MKNKKNKKYVLYAPWGERIQFASRRNLARGLEVIARKTFEAEGEQVSDCMNRLCKHVIVEYVREV